MKHVRLCDAEPGECGMGVLGRVFAAHGQLCASRPWEVIIATLTVILITASLSLFAASNKICDWNYRCEQRASPHDDQHVSTTTFYGKGGKCHTQLLGPCQVYRWLGQKWHFPCIHG